MTANTPIVEHQERDSLRPRRWYYGLWLLIAGTLGLVAAFALTLEKIHSLENPGLGASCDFSLLVQCSANLNSSAGSVFGFPNPIIGLIAWPLVIAMGVLVLSRTKLSHFWNYGFLAGVTGATVFVTWLQYQSIMILGTLCPWCLVTWFAVIPTFLATLTHMGSQGLFGRKLTAISRALKPYVPMLALLWFAAIALWAQVRLDWISYL